MYINSYDKRFLNDFKVYYPFERFILDKPYQINYLFDDAFLTEIFVPSIEIDTFDKLIDYEEVYVKIVCNGITMRFSYFDFSDDIRENIRNYVITSFGKCEWEALSVEQENDYENNNLMNALLKQKKMIEEKYGGCNIKANFCITQQLI